MIGPRFSIITPTYNRAAFISKAIRSVLSQTFVDFEYIIIDDGSTDNTKEIIETFSDIRIKYFKIENSERGFARNFGIKKAIGKYITLLDSDDYYFPILLGEADSFIVKKNNPEFFAQGYQVENADGKFIYAVHYPERHFIERMCRANISGPCGMFIRNDIMMENLFNEDRKFKIAEDLYVFLKIAAKHGIQINHIVTGSVVNHENATMRTLDPYDVIYCRDKIICLLNQEDEFRKYRKSLDKLYSNMSNLAILSFTIQGKYKKPLAMIFSLVRKNPWELFRKRTAVIFRNIARNYILHVAKI